MFFCRHPWTNGTGRENGFGFVRLGRPLRVFTTLDAPFRVGATRRWHREPGKPGAAPALLFFFPFFFFFSFFFSFLFFPFYLSLSPRDRYVVPWFSSAAHHPMNALSHLFHPPHLGSVKGLARGCAFMHVCVCGMMHGRRAWGLALGWWTGGGPCGGIDKPASRPSDGIRASETGARGYRNTGGEQYRSLPRCLK